MQESAGLVPASLLASLQEAWSTAGGDAAAQVKVDVAALHRDIASRGRSSSSSAAASTADAGGGGAEQQTVLPDEEVVLDVSHVFVRVADLTEVAAADTAAAQAGVAGAVRVVNRCAKWPVLVEPVFADVVELGPGCGMLLRPGDRVYLHESRVPCFVAVVRTGRDVVAGAAGLAAKTAGQSLPRVALNMSDAAAVARATADSAVVAAAAAAVSQCGWLLVGQLPVIEVPGPTAPEPLTIGRQTIGVPDGRLSREHFTAQVAVAPDDTSASAWVAVKALGRKAIGGLVGGNAAGNSDTAPTRLSTLTGTRDDEAHILLANGERVTPLDAYGTHTLVVVRDTHAVSASAVPKKSRDASQTEKFIEGMVYHQSFNYQKSKGKRWNKFYVVRYAAYLAFYEGSSPDRRSLRMTLTIDDSMLISASEGVSGSTERRYIAKLVSVNPHGATIGQFFGFEDEATRDRWIAALARDRPPRYSPAEGKLVIHLERAANVRGVDISGSSDPYCTFRIDGRPRYKKKSNIVKNTLNPEWNEAVVLYCALEDTVRVTLWDWNQILKDKQLGEIELHPKDFDSRGAVRVSRRWLGHKAKGTVSLSVSFGEPPETMYVRLAPPAQPFAAVTGADLSRSAAVAVFDGDSDSDDSGDDDDDAAAAAASAAGAPAAADTADHQQQPLSAADVDALRTQQQQAATQARMPVVQSPGEGVTRQALQLFREFDADQGGTLDPQEFSQLLVTLAHRSGLRVPREKELQASFASVDTDGSGEIDVGEFLAFFSAHVAQRMDADSDDDSASASSASEW